MTETFTTDDPFGDDFDLPEGSQSGSKEIEYDRWGRYANLPAIPGIGAQAWTRVTTIAKTLEDTYYLDLWKQRQVVMGIKNNPSLLDPISGARFNPTSQHGKTLLNSIVSTAMDEAGSYTGANKGTAFHDLTEAFDRGDVATMPLDTEEERNSFEMLKAYKRQLELHNITMIPELMERVVACPALGVAGRLDRIISDNGVLRIGDVKSQKTLDFGQMSLAIQLAVYANATHMLDQETWKWVPMPEGLDRSIGVILWVPAEEPGRAEVHDVDLDFGLTLAKAAVRVREWRKTKGLVSRRAVR